MSSSLQRLGKENSYMVGHFFLGFTILSYIMAVTTCLSKDYGIELLISILTSFNIMDVFLIVALVFYVQYFIAIYHRKVFLTKGIRYDGLIIDTIPSSSRTAQYLQFKIQYNGNQTFITSKYSEDSRYRLASQTCAVYVYKGKCYADDFVLERIKNS